MNGTGNVPTTLTSVGHVKIRREADGTAFGGDFEWLCQWFLENAPRYRGQFDQVLLWKDWPERWGTDAGIDFVVRTRTGEL